MNFSIQKVYNPYCDIDIIANKLFNDLFDTKNYNIVLIESFRKKSILM